MSSRSHYLGIPREKIPWYPVINPALCTNCGACIDFCPNQVFTPGESSPEVINPMNCVVGCSACTRECPVEAISFMSQKELVALLKKLRQEMASGKQNSQNTSVKVKIIMDGEIRSCCSSYSPEDVREIVTNWVGDKAEVEILDKNQVSWQPDSLAALAEQYFGQSIYPLVYVDEKLAAIGDIPDSQILLQLIEGQVAFGVTEQEIKEEARRRGLID